MITYLVQLVLARKNNLSLFLMTSALLLTLINTSSTKGMTC